MYAWCVLHPLLQGGFRTCHQRAHELSERVPLAENGQVLVIVGLPLPAPEAFCLHFGQGVEGPLPRPLELPVQGAVVVVVSVMIWLPCLQHEGCQFNLLLGQEGLEIR